MEAERGNADVDAIVATARDYFEGWFDGDEERMARALAPDLVKRRAGEELGITTKERMLELTRQGEGKQDGADRTLDIRVHDVYDDTATATVHSAVYHEHLHLVRTSEGWRIANALWQFT
jgi:hypothetical protein